MKIDNLRGIATHQGIIWNLAWGQLHVAVIECKGGTQRSNHYHKKGHHALYVVSGAMVYEESLVDGTKPERAAIMPGQMVHTEKMRVHRTSFDVDTVLVSLSSHMTEKEYAADTVAQEFRG